ncbi:hypothetical protein [Legionella sp. km772]|uniref:hypothetical protein n=1 Tax=Legionella sp. km772 TaxID=2498111 RepID=UPI000F8C5182|nr:hypothetical protein [Legionella sp. km772]RUR08773.1 hypothetical protein ELY15_10160 [Legionella sp. km772]
MSDNPSNIDFDTQAAWMRRFQADAESNLQAFSLRLKEALSEHVTIHESKPFLWGNPKIIGVSIHLGDYKYTLELNRGQLNASIAMVVRGITLNTKQTDPSEWFAKLAAETQKATEQAKRLSQSLSAFGSS